MKGNCYPKVSVFSLCYNTGRYVVEALESVLNSGYPNIEIIVLDDCSTDLGSLAVLESYIAGKKQIKFIRNTSNLGITKSMNKVLEHMEGKYALGLSDDLIKGNRIIGDVLEFESLDEGYAVVHSISQSIDDYGHKYPEFFPNLTFPDTHEDCIRLEDMLTEPCINTTTATYRVSVLREVGGWDESLKYEDKPMWFKLCEAGKKFKFRPELTTFYRRRIGSVSSNMGFSYQFELYSRYDEFLEAQKKLKYYLWVACGASDYARCLQIYKDTKNASYVLYFIMRGLHPLKVYYNKNELNQFWIVRKLSHFLRAFLTRL